MRIIILSVILVPGICFAKQIECTKAQAKIYSTAFFNALLSSDCKDRLDSLGATDKWRKECEQPSSLRGRELKIEFAKRTSFKFDSLTQKEGKWFALGHYSGPDPDQFYIKLSNNNYCEKLAEPWTLYAPLSEPGKECGSNFWRGIPNLKYKVGVSLQCISENWRVTDFGLTTQSR